jgi:hypothetical protein
VTIVRVEEDWLLIVGDPSLNLASPQVSSQMAPSMGALQFCNFHLNSCDIPTFTQGGMQLQVWEGTTNLAVTTSADRTTMNTPNELVQWTQYLEVNGNELRFGIGSIHPSSVGASSITWGNFGGGSLYVIVPGALPDLENYDIEYSKLHSGVTFGANRVTYLILLGARIYRTGDLPDAPSSTITGPFTIYSRLFDPELGDDN